MPIHSSTDLDPAFNTDTGFAYDCEISEPKCKDYDAPVIIERGVQVESEDSTVRSRVAVLEVRKADLQDPGAGLIRETVIIIKETGEKFYIESLDEETTYTLKYITSK